MEDESAEPLASGGETSPSPVMNSVSVCPADPHDVWHRVAISICKNPRRGCRNLNLPHGNLPLDEQQPRFWRRAIMCLISQEFGLPPFLA